MIELAESKAEISDALRENYLKLSNYLTDYDFGDALITEYFRRYKRIKLSTDDEKFKRQFVELATQRPYNRMETRQTLLDRGCRGAKLYWLDALGAEFSGYIQARALRRGLSVEIVIGRANLPTLTYLNRTFYDEW